MTRAQPCDKIPIERTPGTIDPPAESLPVTTKTSWNPSTFWYKYHRHFATPGDHYLPAQAERERAAKSLQETSWTAGREPRADFPRNQKETGAHGERIPPTCRSLPRIRSTTGAEFPIFSPYREGGRDHRQGKVKARAIQPARGSPAQP